MDSQAINFPGVILVDILTSLPTEVYVILFLLVGLLIASYLLPSLMFSDTSRLRPSDTARLLTASFEPRPLMTSEEATTYNALYMVVRDRFLLLAKVPLRNLLVMKDDSPKIREALVKATKNVIADFVLLHPGTLVPEIVLFVERNGSESSSFRSPNNLLLDLLTRTGISVVHLTSGKPYTVEALTTLLRLDEE